MSFTLIFEAAGWIGNLALAVCGVPLAWDCIRTGAAERIKDLNAFLALWVTGEIGTLIYVIHLADYPLLLNYGANVISLAIVIKYRFWPRTK